MKKLADRFRRSALDGEVEIHDFWVAFPLNSWIRKWIVNPDTCGPMRLTRNPKLGFRTSVTDIQIICKQNDWRWTLKQLQKDGFKEVSD